MLKLPGSIYICGPRCVEEKKKKRRVECMCLCCEHIGDKDGKKKL